MLLEITFSIHITVLPAGWCLENIAKLLKLCGDAVCCEFLGSKAINGRTQELAFLIYYTLQVIYILYSYVYFNTTGYVVPSLEMRDIP